MQGFDSLYVDGAYYATRLTRKYRDRKPYVPRDHRQVRAVLPGAILHILVKAGQSVKRGEGLLVVVAMKMENRITAPIDGRIERILVEVGQSVPKGEMLITFE